MATTTNDAGAQADTKAQADAAAQAATDKAAADKAATDKATADAAAKTKAEADKVGTDAAAKAAADEAANKEAAAKAAGEKKAPAAYKLTIPEKSTIDDGDVKIIEQVARENDWTNEEAQAALDRHNVTLIEQSARFLEQTKADTTYGGDNLAVTQARAKALLDRVRPASTPQGKAIRALLDKSGYGNHLEVVSLLADLGKMMEEDSPAVGGNVGGAKTVEEKLYDGK